MRIDVAAAGKCSKYHGSVEGLQRHRVSQACCFISPLVITDNLDTRERRIHRPSLIDRSGRCIAPRSANPTVICILLRQRRRQPRAPRMAGAPESFGKWKCSASSCGLIEEKTCRDERRPTNFRLPSPAASLRHDRPRDDRTVLNPTRPNTGCPVGAASPPPRTQRPDAGIVTSSGTPPDSIGSRGRLQSRAPTGARGLSQGFVTNKKSSRGGDRAA